jgi:4-hydroxybenzoate polyprenyltransferase
MSSSEPNTAGCVEGAQAPTALPPLCVDLDGTLVHGDLLWECLVLLLKHRPASLLLLPFWLLFLGRAGLKRRLAERVTLEPGSLVYNHELINFLKAELLRGRSLALVTATDQRLAEAVAAHTGLFARIHGSDGRKNLKGREKAAFLRETFGENAFEYAGDSAADMPVWKIASGAYVVGSQGTARRAASVTELRRWFPRQSHALRCWTRAIRVHHWSKNLLMLVPTLLAHRLSRHELLPTFAGMIVFGVCASGIYLLNDLLDLHSDRAHPWKSSRPFASGELSIASGLISCGLMLGAAFVVGSLLSADFAWVMALYAATAITYSLYIKKVVILDVFILSSFYSLRIYAGALITHTPLSQWFLGFSLFFFLSLAMAKRYSELKHAAELVTSGKSGRGYRASDRELLMNIGMASCFAAIVILTLYVHSSEVVALYGRPGLLLLLCPLILYWTCRIWLKAQRGELNEDPITLAMRDPLSYGVALAGLVIMLVASGKLFR